MDELPPSRARAYLQGIIASLPLVIALTPWGLLAGSYAIDSGFSPIESQAFSLVIYAGAAQLVATGMLKSGVGILTLLLTTFFISSRHFLYGAAMRSHIRTLPTRWRLLLGFFLTDELFALTGGQQKTFNRWYTLGVGSSLYIFWNLASLAGILLGHSIPEMKTIGLNFAIAATFIAITVPTVKTVPIFVTVLVGLVLSVVCQLLQIKGGLMITSIVAMGAGYLTETLLGKKHDLS